MLACNVPTSMLIPARRSRPRRIIEREVRGVYALMTLDVYIMFNLNLKAMNVQIQSVKFDASHQLIEFIEKKLAKLDRVAEDATGVDVVLKLEKDDEKGNKVAVITLRLPGGDIRVEEQAHTFEEAIDNAKDVLKRQIEKRKDK